MPWTQAYAETVELIRRAQAGERECLDHVLERYRDRLLLRIRCMLGRDARVTAESGDFLQNVFVKVLEHFDKFEQRDESSFLRWATQIARNDIRDELCRRHDVAVGSLGTESGVLPDGEFDRDTPSVDAANAEELAQLVDALSELEDDHRRVIELRHFDRLSFAEIGRRLGRSENAVQLLHTRLLLRLGRLLGGGGSE